MYKCEMCGAVSEVEAKCPKCNVDMKKVEATPEAAPVTPQPTTEGQVTTEEPKA
ncbi:MAG: hypothetical protein AB1333_01280 [Patescibacteria group bacterium]